jgi:hypothetical protein
MNRHIIYIRLQAIASAADLARIQRLEDWMNRFCVSRLGWLLEASVETAVLARACTGWLAAGLALAGG